MYKLKYLALEIARGWFMRRTNIRYDLRTDVSMQRDILTLDMDMDLDIWL